MARKAITFKDILNKQKEDLKANRIGNSIYRTMSRPFTLLFLKLGVTANAITLFTYFLAILGYIFLTFGTYIYIIIGIFLFILFYTIDSSDGDVARITNDKSSEGLFFDEISHYLWAMSLGIGLGFGLTKLYNNDIYLTLGIIVATSIVLEHVVDFALRSNVRKEAIDNNIKMEDYTLIQGIYNYICHEKNWGQGNLVKKIFGIYPFKGHLYTLHFLCPILIILAIVDFVIYFIFGFQIVIYGVIAGLMPLYLTVASAVRMVWVSIFIYKMKKNMYITQFINKNK